MKRNRLMYALPLAALLATAAASRLALADSSSSADPAYGTPSQSGGQMSNDTMSKEQQSTSAMSDAAITAKVKSALLAERGLPSSQIKVQTNDGVVQLSGFLNSTSEIDRAVSVARHVKDVKSVENKMQTK